MGNLKVLYNTPANTIKSAISIIGIAPYSAKQTRITINPSSSGMINFFHNDVEILLFPASIDTTDKRHFTALRRGSTQLKSVEHLLSVLHGLNINSVDIIISQEPEVPAFDSSADNYTKLLLGTGKTSLSFDQPVLVVTDQFRIQDTASDSCIEFNPNDKGLEISTIIDFPNIIGHQEFHLTLSEQSYVNEISWARTFFSKPISDDSEEWKYFRSVLPFLPERVEDSPIIAFNKDKYIINPKKDNEPVRHKTLDFIGDIYTLGLPIFAKVKLYKPSHHLNHTAATYLFENNVDIFQRLFNKSS